MEHLDRKNHLENTYQSKVLKNLSWYQLILTTSLSLFVLMTFIFQQAFSQNYPTFGNEKLVTINGLSFDAMEPFISPDGNTLFFNSLNSGGNTNLYYATRNNDTIFTFAGMVNGTYDSSSNHLDAVASIDSANNFFWVSLRYIPNLHKGNYAAGTVNNVSQVFGTSNILAPSGWLIMDAAIDYRGNLLYYSNGYFGPTYTECIGAPCEAKMGIAEKVNDSTFNKSTNSDAILANVNDTNYLVYAPQVTVDGLELYYTRLLKASFDTELCVAVRNDVVDAFSLPSPIYSSLGFFPEAATLSADKQKMYYHKKNTAGIYNILLRYRTGTATNINAINNAESIRVFPNPADNFLHISIPNSPAHFTVSVYSTLGEQMHMIADQASIDISNLARGMYFITVNYNETTWTTKIVKE